jgi:GDP-D-mannose dehydratase
LKDLISGGCGFQDSYLTAYLREHGYAVEAMTNRVRRGNEWKIDPLRMNESVSGFSGTLV